MMLPEFEGKRFYVNALTGRWITFPIGGTVAGNARMSTQFSVHDLFYGGKRIASFPKYRTDTRPTETQRQFAFALADRLNAEEAAA